MKLKSIFKSKKPKTQSLSLGQFEGLTKEDLAKVNELISNDGKKSKFKKENNQGTEEGLKFSLVRGKKSKKSRTYFILGSSKNKEHHVFGKGGTSEVKVAARIKKKENKVELKEIGVVKKQKRREKSIEDFERINLKKLKNIQEKEDKDAIGLSLDSDTYYIFTKKILSGWNLLDCILDKTWEKVPFAKKFDLVIALLQDVQRLHNQNEVHRDLTPGNIMVDIDTTQVKLTDYETRVKIGKGIKNNESGTILYMPPETIDSEKDVALSLDIYALGIIIAEILSPYRPYPNKGAYLDGCPVLKPKIEVYDRTKKNLEKELKNLLEVLEEKAREKVYNMPPDVTISLPEFQHNALQQEGLSILNRLLEDMVAPDEKVRPTIEFTIGCFEKLKEKYFSEEKQVYAHIDLLGQLKFDLQLNLKKEERQALSDLQTKWEEKFKDHYLQYPSCSILEKEEKDEKQKDFKRIIGEIKDQISYLAENENTKVLIEGPNRRYIHHLFMNMMVGLAMISGIAMVITQVAERVTHQEGHFLNNFFLVGAVATVGTALKSYTDNHFAFFTNKPNVVQNLEEIVSNIDGLLP